MEKKFDRPHDEQEAREACETEGLILTNDQRHFEWTGSFYNPELCYQYEIEGGNLTDESDIYCPSGGGMSPI